MVERAGGRASDSQARILERMPVALHERTPRHIGSADRVAFLERILAGG